MFDRLTDGFNSMFRNLSGKGKISEKNVRESMEEVRQALLEADVHHEVVKKFCADVLSDALGKRVTESVEPGQEMIAIVHERLVEALGGEPGAASGDDAFGAPGLPGSGAGAMAGGAAADAGIMRVSPGPTIVMMCGLQGSGKTTTCGKLAWYLKKQGRSTMLVAADLQRPAAVEQLGVVAAQVREQGAGSARVEFYAEPDKCDEYGKAVGVAVQVCRRGVEQARKLGIDTVILDTAGRLHVNDELMDELRQITRSLNPHHVFLVIDAMTGQDAVKSAKTFHELLSTDGLILTKFDSDTRGGAALSAKHVTGAPIRFVGVGEKLEAIEEFHADRMAGRILGMGDVVSLVERAREQVSDEDAEKIQEKMAKGQLTMDDFLSQLRTLRRMGPMKHLLGMLPGVGSALKDVHVDEKELDRVEAMVNSMTLQERKRPDVLNNSRRRRVSEGSGTTQQQVSQLVKQVGTINQVTKSLSSLSGAGRVRAVKELSKGGAMDAMLPGVGGLPGLRSRGTTSSSFKKNFKKRKK